MSRSMIPLQRWIAPGRWPRRHSSSSRTSTSVIGSPATRIRSTSATVSSRTRRRASSTRRRKPGECFISLVAALGADEPILGVGEEHVERRETAVRACDVVLELEPVLVAQLRVRVDALLEDAQALADRDDFPEERLDRHGLLLRPGLPGLHHQLAAGPA